MVYFRVPGFRFSVHNKLVLPRLSCTSSRAQHAAPRWGLRGSQHGHKMMDDDGPAYLPTYIHTGIQMKTRRYTDKQTDRHTCIHTRTSHTWLGLCQLGETLNRTQSLSSSSRPGPLDPKQTFQEPEDDLI